MSTGIIYITTTAVNGLIKIGVTDNFERRMYQLEGNGYKNVTGLKRYFAIKTKNYQEKETLIHTIFSKSQVADTELFTLDKNLARELLKCFEGEIIYDKEEPIKKKKNVPKNTAKTEQNNVNNKASQDSLITEDNVDDETIFYFSRFKKKENKQIDAKMKIVDGKYVVLKGSSICQNDDGHGRNTRQKYFDECGHAETLQKDVECKSPSGAGELIFGTAINGWTEWKDKNGNTLELCVDRTKKNYNNQGE